VFLVVGGGGRGYDRFLGGKESVNRGSYTRSEIFIAVFTSLKATGGHRKEYAVLSGDFFKGFWKPGEWGPRERRRRFFRESFQFPPLRPSLRLRKQQEPDERRREE